MELDGKADACRGIEYPPDLRGGEADRLAIGVDRVGQTFPGGGCVRRSNWQVALAMLVPPLKNSASTTLIR